MLDKTNPESDYNDLRRAELDPAAVPLPGSGAYVLDAANVVHEAVEGEVVIVNLATGRYHSLDGAAAQIWERLVQGARISDLATLLSNAYGEAPAVIAPAVESFIRQLAAEGLVLLSSDSHPVSPSPLPPQSGSFPELVLHSYTDMEELLLVDPIHQTSDQGWPHLSTPEAAFG